MRLSSISLYFKTNFYIIWIDMSLLWQILLERLKKDVWEVLKTIFYEMIVMGIIWWLFDLVGLVSKNIFKVSERTIEQYDDNVLLKIVPLTLNTCLLTNRSCWVRTSA